MAFKDSLDDVIRSSMVAGRKPRTKAVKYDEPQDKLKHLNIKHSDGFIERLDNWRATRRPILSRSAAIKLMCEERMAADAGKDGAA